jgi:hypothetical protein
MWRYAARAFHNALLQWREGLARRVGYFWPLSMTPKRSQFRSWGAEVLWPRTEAAGMVDAIIEAPFLGKLHRLAS